jgi:hypothetical protein
MDNIGYWIAAISGIASILQLLIALVDLIKRR